MQQLATTSTIPLTGFTGLRRFTGEEIARKLIAAFPGQRIYIPQVRVLTEDHKLVVCVGIEWARRISEIFSGLEIQVPLGPEGHVYRMRSDIAKLHSDGLTATAAAKALGIHPKTAQRWYRRLGFYESSKSPENEDKGNLAHETAPGRVPPTSA